MAKYYYSKYTVNSTQVWQQPPWVHRNDAHTTVNGRWTSYTFDNINNKFYTAGTKLERDSLVYSGRSYYTAQSSGDLDRVVITESFSGSEVASKRFYQSTYRKSVANSTRTTVYSRGSLIESDIIAENGTYPTNGRSGGYWYVRGGLAISSPSLTTTGAVSITGDSATIGGNISDTGGENPTRYIEWGTTTAYGNTVNLGAGGTGDFTTNLTGLSPNITYYFRAYATNSGGTTYGSQMSFTTETLLNFKYKINGEIKSISEGFYKENGIWKPLTSAYIKVSGEWK